MSFDWICHSFPCAECGATPADCDELGMQTKLAEDADLRQLRAGVSVRVPDDLEATGSYIQVGESPARRIIEHWVCPTCAAWQWAVVTIADSTVAAIEPIRLDAVGMTTARYVSTAVVHLLPPSLGVHDLAAVSLSQRRAVIADAEQSRLHDRAVWFALTRVAERQPLNRVELERTLTTERRVVPPGESARQLVDELISRDYLALDGEALRLRREGQAELARHG